ncbi:MAG: hypothetical protein IMF06_00600 [Proteobacteria bacterium]|nr:hypothetical protein [Pseudomonadota bacterium]
MAQGLLDGSGPDPSVDVFLQQHAAYVSAIKAAGMQVDELPALEEGAANIVRMNDHVFISRGYPQSEALLKTQGYRLVVLDTSEAAKVDGGLSCMSLRF